MKATLPVIVAPFLTSITSYANPTPVNPDNTTRENQVIVRMRRHMWYLLFRDISDIVSPDRRIPLIDRLPPERHDRIGLKLPVQVLVDRKPAFHCQPIFQTHKIREQDVDPEQDVQALPTQQGRKRRLN